jgi:hypothetical protein
MRTLSDIPQPFDTAALFLMGINDCLEAIPKARGFLLLNPAHRLRGAMAKTQDGVLVSAWDERATQWCLLGRIEKELGGPMTSLPCEASGPNALLPGNSWGAILPEKIYAKIWELGPVSDVTADNRQVVMKGYAWLETLLLEGKRNLETSFVRRTNP